VTPRIMGADYTHAEMLGRELRPVVRAELDAFGDPIEETRRALLASTWAAMCLDERGAVAAWGCLEGGTIAAPVGWPWCLTTPRVDAHRRFFARGSRLWLGSMLARCRRLEGWVDDRYPAAQRWLLWLGFALGEPRPIGPLGVPFRPFAIERRR
jgi:hypothetical protein